MNLFLFIILLFIFFSAILFGVIFFQLPTLNYSTTGCDTKEGEEKIKSALDIYRKMLIGGLVSLSIACLLPISSLVINILAKVFTGVGGSFVSIAIAIVELVILFVLISFMTVILINIIIAISVGCSKKDVLTEKLNYIYNLSRISFIISIVLSILVIIGIVIYSIYKYKNPKIEYDENMDFEEEEQI